MCPLGSIRSFSAPRGAPEGGTSGGEAPESGSFLTAHKGHCAGVRGGWPVPRPGHSAPAWAAVSGQENRTAYCLIHSASTITAHSCLPGRVSCDECGQER